MRTDQPPAKPAPTKLDNDDAGDGVELTVTEARSAVPRGISKVLVISTTLAVIGIGLVWFMSERPVSQPTPKAAQVSAQPQAAQAQTALASGAWDRRGLGAAGLEKCRAFGKVLSDTRELQASGGGALSKARRGRLDTELNAAKAMAPATLTPAQCGVPL
jgi:hypothetical protein